MVLKREPPKRVKLVNEALARRNLQELQEWWGTPTTSALRQEDFWLEACLNYRVSSRLAAAI